MRHCASFTVVTLVASCLPQIGLSQDVAPRVIERFGNVTDPGGDCQLTKNDKTLTITIPNTHHDLTYTNEYTKLNSPRVLQPVEGDFMLQVIVGRYALPGNAASSGGQHSFVSAGLLVWQDDKNFIRLERAAVAKSETPFVWVERFEDGKSVSGEMVRVSDQDTGLRVVRQGKRFTFLYDDGGHGTTWKEAHADVAELPADLKVGVAAINTTVREFVAKLSDLELGKSTK